MITLPLDQMSHAEKLSAMEALWQDLTADPGYTSPPWHASVLRETEARVQAGTEAPIPWDKAKQQLRARFE